MMKFFTFLERSFSDINCLPTQWHFDLERKRCSRVVKLAFDKEDVMSKPLYISVNENENHWILVIVFPKPELVVSYEPLKTDFKRKASEIILTFLTSYGERRNQSMNFQSWKLGILDGRKQLNATDCQGFVTETAMEIATKESIFDWIASQCLCHNFPRSIPKQIKTQVQWIVMVQVYTTSKIYFTLEEENKTKLLEMEVWMVKTVRRFFLWFCITMILWSVSDV